MKAKISLKRLITLSFLLFGGTIVLGYSLLSAHFFIRGMDNIVTGGMENAALTYLASNKSLAEDEMVNFRGSQLSRRWEAQSADIRQVFTDPPQRSGELIKRDDSYWFERPDKVYFALKVDLENQSVYISRTLSRENVSSLVGRNMADSMRLLLGVSALIALTLMLITWLLMRSISSPVARLNNWTQSLTPENLSQPLPDFLYPELNQMARLIQNSLSSVQRSLDREHRFLRYTSHELRTPISVIRNNIELQYKVLQQTSSSLNPMQRDIADRIDRASITMQHLTETLLWLSREDNEKLPESVVEIDKLLLEITEEMRYLLRDKSVELIVETHPYQSSISAVAARIVLGNLIRNAFQHTWEGQVIISQQGSQISIVNRQFNADIDVAPTELGFGLGLQLTAQLTEKLGWSYQNIANENGHNVILDITPSETN
ncbi:MAG: HAMP domain-containing sensor histidine kinase [Methylophaga sp.]|uniref:sensor histidine kinase n=1 Tax=Methylophaga sp. TaxID=2024840 RepID=UPI00299DF097|nr:HAMP domain-containing sensor histidine kinase [Methylophaga sp.]MDX1750799.1 HAMP domain-containing sensor histidine kinase [Methylophaga sp.]|tara:strand:+ start:501 stop:1796 length:1296 start_codon:yes stop_codon:yes gene_type:complete